MKRPTPRPPPDFGPRVELALSAAVGPELGMQSRAAAMHGVTRVTVHAWIHGRCYPATTRLVAICDAAGCTADWLLRGRGEPPVVVPAAPPAPVASVAAAPVAVEGTA